MPCQHITLLYLNWNILGILNQYILYNCRTLSTVKKCFKLYQQRKPEMRPNRIKPINKCLNHSLVIQSHLCPISINNKLYEEKYLSVLQICVLGQSLTCVPRQAKQSLSNSDIPFTFVLLSAPNKPTFVIFSAHKI